MAFAKVRYNTGEDIKMENTHGSKIEEWVFMSRDFPQWINTMCSKYGFNLQRPKTDLDWAK